MTTTQLTRFFSKERKNTDASLGAERTKATDSINVANTKSQVRTDEIVKDERNIADRKTASSRARHDTDRGDSSGSRTKHDSQKQINAERLRSDEATEVERSNVDAAILDERLIASQLVNEVLSSERTATDNSLKLERDSTDGHVGTSSRTLEGEKANHAKTKISLTSRDELLAVVSHDLRNPVGSVKAYADLLLDGIEGEAPMGPVGVSFVEAIKRNAEVSLRLIEDLLDAERIAQGKLEIRIRANQVDDIISEVLLRFAPLAQERDIKLVVTNPCLACEVECDRDRILQVLGNLIGNALKFTPAGGQVSITATREADSIQFAVADTGSGIAEEKLLEIFERSTQLGGQRANRSGLGLGLFIARTLVEAHHGKIWVDSKLGGGSTFKFSLPSKLNH